MKRSWSEARSQTILAFYLSLAIVGFFWHAIEQDSNDIWRLDPSLGPIEMGKTLLYGVVLAAIVIGFFRWLEKRTKWPALLQDDIQSLLGQLQAKEILLLAASSSIGEELLFRGALLDAWGPWLSSLAFCLLHIPPRWKLWPWTLSAGLVGLCFAGLTLWTQNLGPAIVAHFVINFVNLHLMTRATAKTMPRNYSSSPNRFSKVS